MARTTFLALALAGLSAVPSAGQQRGDEVAISAVRFYRAADGQTRVRAFITIPRSVVWRAGAGDPGYGISVQVRDSSGLMLHRESWRRQPAAGSAAPMVETLYFSVAPGAYRVDVEVSGGGKAGVRRAALDLAGYADDPGASDLLLASAMRIDWNLEALVGPGEIRHGSTVITPTTLLRLSPSESRAYYLLEAYLPADSAAAGTMEAAITDQQGEVVVRTTPVPVALDPGGGVLRGQVNLEGLPPGRYAMRVRVRLGERELERAGEILMMAPGAERSGEKRTAVVGVR